MQDYNKDIWIGVMFITGILCFLSAQFIFSTVLFGIAAIYSNIAPRAKLNS